MTNEKETLRAASSWWVTSSPFRVMHVAISREKLARRDKKHVKKRRTWKSWARRYELHIYTIAFCYVQCDFNLAPNYSAGERARETILAHIIFTKAKRCLLNRERSISLRVAQYVAELMILRSWNNFEFLVKRQNFNQKLYSLSSFFV